MNEIGWTKARLLDLCQRKGEARRALSFARQNTLALMAYLRDGENQTGMVNKFFALPPSDAQELDDALILAGGSMHGKRMGNRPQALMTIVRSFIAL